MATADGFSSTWTFSLSADTLRPVISSHVSREIVKAGQQPSHRELAAFPDSGAAGTYQLSATYYAPEVEGSDQKTLRNKDIDFPQSQLESNRLSFVKQR